MKYTLFLAASQQARYFWFILNGTDNWWMKNYSQHNKHGYVTNFQIWRRKPKHFVPSNSGICTICCDVIRKEKKNENFRHLQWRRLLPLGQNMVNAVFIVAQSTTTVPSVTLASWISWSTQYCARFGSKSYTALNSVRQKRLTSHAWNNNVNKTCHWCSSAGTVCQLKVCILQHGNDK